MLKRLLIPAVSIVSALLAVAVQSATTSPQSQVVKQSNPAKPAVRKPAPPAPQLLATRRITESQYKHTVAAIFGSDIQINGRFEPERREEGLLAIGGSLLSISASGFEQYYAMAKGVAEQVFDPKRRAKFVGCVPADEKVADDHCATEFLSTYGRLLFRHPLTAAELQPRVALARNSATQTNNYYSGLKLALTSLLTAPEYLFRIETLEKDPTRANANRLDGYSKAARLSFLFWDSSPDDELLKSAASGELHTQTGVEKQVTRLLASSNTEAGVRAFFSDMLEFELFDSLTKDAAIYPKFSQEVSDSAKEQTLRTAVDHLMVKNSSYLDLFTTRSTFLNRALASVYQVPFLSNTAQGPTGWQPYTFDETSDRAGVLTQISFLSIFSHPGRSSPTKRGAALREIFMCDPTPLPPANVDFSIVNDTKNPNLKTVRARLLAHSEDDSCNSCHKRSDPLGLSLERFDSLAQYRVTENGDPIDASAELGGKKFEGAQGLGKILHENPKVPACLVRNVYAYGVGHAPTDDEQKYLDQASQVFASDGYRMPRMMQRVATSPEFFAVPNAAITHVAIKSAAIKAAAPKSAAVTASTLIAPASVKFPGAAK